MICVFPRFHPIYVNNDLTGGGGGGGLLCTLADPYMNNDS